MYWSHTSETLPPYPQVVIPGRAPDADGAFNEVMESLAVGAVELYKQQLASDIRTNPTFTFTGESSMVLGRNHEMDESARIGQRAIELGLPEHLVRYAGGTNTFENFKDAIEQGHVNPAEPVIAIVRKPHAHRVKYIGSRIFPDVHSYVVGTDPGIQTKLFELGTLAVTRLAFAGVHHSAPNEQLEALSRRAAMLERVTAPLFKFVTNVSGS